MNTEQHLNRLLEDLEEGNLEIAFNKPLRLQAIIYSEGLEFTGKIIDVNGQIVCETEFGFDSLLPPSASDYIEAFYYSYVNDIDIIEAVEEIAKNKKQL